MRTLNGFALNDNLREASKVTRIIEEMLDFYIHEYKNENELSDDDLEYGSCRISLLDDGDKVTFLIKGYDTDSTLYVDSITDWQNL